MPTPFPNPLVRETAVAYAATYAVTPNPAYNYYPLDEGGDCTNFVSQATHAGGYPMMETGPNGGWYHTPWTDSLAWSNVGHFLGHFEITGWAVDWGEQLHLDDEQYNAAYLGDILIYDWEGDGELDHMTVEVAYDGIDPGTPYPEGKGWQGDLVDAHGREHYHGIWHLNPYNLYRDTTVIYLEHVNYTP
jgi:hypothetical protein